MEHGSTYNNSTGVITYTGPNASEARNTLVLELVCTLSSGEISIGHVPQHMM